MSDNTAQWTGTLFRTLTLGLLCITAIRVNAQLIREIDPFPVSDESGLVFEQPFFGGFDRPIPQLVDIDGDGDLDLFVQEDEDILRFFENVGSASVATFRWRTDQFGGLNAEWFHFADLDSDSDFDLIVGVNFNEIDYLENSGTAFTWDFSSANQPIVSPEGTRILSDPPMVPSVVDVDCNGRLDLFLGQQDGTIRQFEQELSSAAAPVFALVTDKFQNIIVAPAAKNESGLHGANAQAFFDADLDGDIDLYYGDFFETSILFFQNNGSCPTIEMERVSDTLALGPDDNFLNNGYNVPTPADLNGDGQADLVVGTLSKTTSSFVENLSYLANDLGSFSLVSNRLVNGVDVGTLSIPAVGDVDGDGDLDIVLGSSLSSPERATLVLLERSGSSSLTAFGITDSDFLSLNIGFNYAPTFADIDSDGDDDLLVGLYNGRIALLRRESTSPYFTLVTEFFSGIDVGSNATPALGDVDGDGDLDLIVGESTGELNFFENVGTPQEPTFGSGVPAFAGIDVGQVSKPTLYDWDADGDLDLVLGGNTRGLLIAENSGTPQSMTLEAPEPLGIDAGFQASASFTDIDGDGDDDLLVGDRSGGLRFFRNGEFSTALEDTVRRSGHLVDSVYPNPVTRSALLSVVPATGGPHSGPVVLTLTDLLGRTIAATRHPSFEEPIRFDLGASLAAGVYLLRVDQEGRSDRRVIVAF